MGRKRKKNPNGEERRKKKKKKEEPVPLSTSGNSSSWAELPELAVDSIIHRLVSVPDLVSFTSTCRSWRSFHPPSLHSFPPLLFLPILSSSSSSSSPLGHRHLTWSHSDLKTLTLDSFRCKLPSKGLARLKFHGYSHGHLLLSVPHRSLLLADVFSGELTTTPFPPQSPTPRIILLLPAATGTNILFATETSILCYHRPRVGTKSYWSPRLDHGATSLSLFQGRVFAIDSSATLHSVHLTSECIRSERVQLRLPEPSGSFLFCRDFGHRLVACGADLLLIRVSINLLPPLRRRIDAFRLNLQE